MSHLRSSGGQADVGAAPRAAAKHRLPPPPSSLRGRIVIAAVAIGAFGAAAGGQTLQAVDGASTDEVTPLANSTKASDNAAAFGVGGSAPAAPQILQVARQVDPSAEAGKLVKSQRITEQREAEEAEARRPKRVAPTRGSFTSGFGYRDGAMHYGLDIAAPIGTPIYAAADGVVIEAGPASGFGLWVKVEHADGTVTVYGHMYRFNVRKGQQVLAGEQIAEVGNNGVSFGAHLHFEVWNAAGVKTNPLPWLNEAGITV
ncbi:M23 family metallopeptidase [Umezawaea endophytica]|uniref:M23 family metallopeptidase n=1 Tax=Umezawaea endophytica TaxID=1654476 RepID=A0A9X3AG25_9PSEU|nr:M23 family metallopeptidase [Umezawaea endophytica]MCS7479537.1 M23 family metallopeptidase [Umezawaea endophytica]